MHICMYNMFTQKFICQRVLQFWQKRCLHKQSINSRMLRCYYIIRSVMEKKGRDGSSCCACICERERGTRRGPCRWKCSILRIKRNIIQSFRFVRIWCVRIGDLWMDLPCMGYEHQFFCSCAGCGWWCNQLPHHYKAIHCDAHLCAREHDDY